MKAVVLALICMLAAAAVVAHAADAEASTEQQQALAAAEAAVATTQDAVAVAAEQTQELAQQLHALEDEEAEGEDEAEDEDEAEAEAEVEDETEDEEEEEAEDEDEAEEESEADEEADEDVEEDSEEDSEEDVEDNSPESWGFARFSETDADTDKDTDAKNKKDGKDGKAKDKKKKKKKMPHACQPRVLGCKNGKKPYSDKKFVAKTPTTDGCLALSTIQHLGRGATGARMEHCCKAHNQCYARKNIKLDSTTIISFDAAIKEHCDDALGSCLKKKCRTLKGESRVDSCLDKAFDAWSNVREQGCFDYETVRMTYGCK